MFKDVSIPKQQIVFEAWVLECICWACPLVVEMIIQKHPQAAG